MIGHRSLSRRGHVIMMICIVMVLVVPFFVHAGDADPTSLLSKIGEAVFGTPKPPSLTEVIGKLIQLVLGFVGTIFFVLMLYAGFLWMTAQGDPEKVTKARDMIVQATIGVVIIALAYVITFTVLTEIPKALK